MNDRWMRSRDCPCSSRTSAGIARTAGLARGISPYALLYWAHATGCPWDEETCNALARRGELDTLLWARREGCKWSEQTCAEAARGGHLEVLKSLRAEGCPWGPTTCSRVCEGGVWGAGLVVAVVDVVDVSVVFVFWFFFVSFSADTTLGPRSGGVGPFCCPC